MAITRFGHDGSDVYVYISGQGIECCGCSLVDGRVCLKTGAEMVARLRKHQQAGHVVPDYTFIELDVL